MRAPETSQYTPEGFTWGSMVVERLARFDRGKRGIWRVVRVNDLDVYVSPTGRTRVFRRATKRRPSVELKPQKGSR